MDAILPQARHFGRLVVRIKPAAANRFGHNARASCERAVSSSMDTGTTESKPTQTKPDRASHFGRYLAVGFLTVAPLWVTWLVFQFLVGLLAGVGDPLLNTLSSLVAPFAPQSAAWLRDGNLHTLVAVLITLALVYGIGVFTSFVLGKRLVSFFESLLARLPLVQTIYGGTKRFVQSITTPPTKGQRVVLIAFPTRSMKAVGFLTTVMKDTVTGRELAAVYVPTAPNPTSGYIEIVPVEDVVHTDWTMEQAMTFVMTGGATAPDSIRYQNENPEIKAASHG